MSEADKFLGSVQAAYRRTDPAGIARLLDPLNEDSARLRASLNANPHLRPSSYTSHTKAFFSDNLPFADFVAAFLLFIRDADTSADNAQSALNAFELLSSCYRCVCDPLISARAEILPTISLAISILAGQESAWFVPTLRKLANALPTLAFKADSAAGDFNNTQAGIASRLLTRSLSICAAERDAVWPSKRNAVFFLANQSFKVYFHLNNLRLCDTVVKNVRDAIDYLDTQYPRADRVTFSYYMGRMYLYQRRMRRAMYELRKAFALCTNQQFKNKRLILVYLITASLPLGYLPRPEMLEAFELQGQYEGLIYALKLGDYRQCLQELDTWREWHLRKGNYLLLKEKLEVICWRNLARRTLLIHRDLHPPQSNGPPTLPLSTMLRTSIISFGPSEQLDQDDIEAMCASLMEQGYIKAYIWQSKGMLVLQKGERLGFPAVSSVRMIGDDA